MDLTHEIIEIGPHFPPGEATRHQGLGSKGVVLLFAQLICGTQWTSGVPRNDPNRHELNQFFGAPEFSFEHCFLHRVISHYNTSYTYIYNELYIYIHIYIYIHMYIYIYTYI